MEKADATQGAERTSVLEAGIDSALDYVREIRAFTRELDERLQAGLRPYGLSCVQGDALMAISQLQPCALKELSEHCIAESGHPSRLVARMKERGLVHVERSREDARTMQISLTPLGEDMARKAFAVRDDIASCLSVDAAQMEMGLEHVRQLRRDLKRG